jgi:hypothetical protein
MGDCVVDQRQYTHRGIRPCREQNAVRAVKVCGRLLDSAILKQLLASSLDSTLDEGSVWLFRVAPSCQCNSLYIEENLSDSSKD